MDELTRLRKENEALKKRIASLTQGQDPGKLPGSTTGIAQAVDRCLGGVVITDNNWRIQYVNPAMLRLWGQDSIDDVIGKGPDDFLSVSPEQIERIIKTIYREGTWRGDVVGKRKDNSTFPVSMAGSRLMDYDGVFMGIVASCIDMTDYQQAMAALSESEARYRKTLDHLGDSVYVVDRDLVIVYINERIDTYAKMLGVDFRGSIGRKITEINIELGYDVEAEFRDVIETGKPLVTEGLMNLGTGTLSVEKRRIPIVNDGVVTHVVNVLHNITDRKIREEQLRQSEEKYRAIADSVPVGIFIHVGGSIRYAGKEAARMLGFEVEEILGTNIMDFIHEDDRPLVAERARRRALGEDVPSGYEVKVVRKDGDIVPILIYGSNIEYLGEKAIQGVFIDISERKKVEKELEETLHRLRSSEERYRVLVESSNDGIVVVSDLNMVFFNRRVLSLLGYGQEELMNRPFVEVVHPDDRERVLNNYLKRLGGESPPGRYEFRVIAKDKTILNVDISVVFTEWEGKPSSLCFIRDITQQKIAEAERVKLNDQLLHAQKMEAIGTLAGGMAHNFNNILVGIMGYSEYLLIKKGEKSPDFKALKTIHEGSVKASELTRQLLNIARGGEFKRVRVSLNDIVKRALPLISGTFNKSIEIETYLDPNLMVIEGDVGQLEQSLLNICINARDAMPEGGKLIIETNNQELDQDFVRAHLGSKVGYYAVISVTDTGIGIPTQDKSHIFEPFFTTKKQAGGTGMGLATVWGIVKNHQGLLTVYSEPGKGATFRLYFPAIFVQVEKEDLKKEEMRLGGGETLLLVDDEPIVREMWGEILAELGYHVLPADGGTEALAVLKERAGNVDLVILDLVMPRMGGRETFDRIRELYPNVIVLVSSGYSENGEARELMTAGADGFIQKPYQIRQVMMKIREMLDGRKKESP